MLAVSAAIEGVNNLIIPNPPPGWTLALDPPEIGPFQNKWQLWKRNDGAFAIVVRETIPQSGSTLEDVIALMIEAKGAIDFGPFKIDYAFAGIVDIMKSAEPLALAKFDGMFAALMKATGHSAAAITGFTPRIAVHLVQSLAGGYQDTRRARRQV